MELIEDPDGIVISDYLSDFDKTRGRGPEIKSSTSSQFFFLSSLIFTLQPHELSNPGGRTLERISGTITFDYFEFQRLSKITKDYHRLPKFY
jgi:hypothetical protein